MHCVRLSNAHVSVHEIERDVMLRSTHPSSQGTVSDPLAAYPSVRALTRGLTVLEVLAEHDQLPIARLAELSGIDRGTMYRLVATLVRRGFVEFDAEIGVVAPGFLLAELARAHRAEEPALRHIRGAIETLTRRVLWPADFAMLRGGALTIRASSHRLSPMTIYRRLVGQSRPVTRSALGMAILTAMPAEQRATLLDILRTDDGPDAEDLAVPGLVEQRLAETATQGFAYMVGLINPKVTGVALPVRLPGGQIGAVNLVIFSRVVRKLEVAETLVPALAECVAEIEARTSADAVV